MISLETYLQNPCVTLSIPYWKTKSITIPENMKIVHERNFSAELLRKYEDETYFRLYNPMKKLIEPELDGYKIVTPKHRYTVRNYGFL